MKVAAPSLAPILRSDAQGRILARVLADPDKSHSLSDLVAATGPSMPTVLREVRRGEQAAILTTEKVGPMRQVRARVDHPLYGAVRRIILATYGPPTVVAEEFAHIQGAEAVLLIGSWAARYLGEARPSPKRRRRAGNRRRRPRSRGRRCPTGRGTDRDAGPSDRPHALPVEI